VGIFDVPERLARRPGQDIRLTAVRVAESDQAGELLVCPCCGLLQSFGADCPSCELPLVCESLAIPAPRVDCPVHGAARSEAAQAAGRWIGALWSRVGPIVVGLSVVSLFVAVVCLLMLRFDPGLW